MPVVLGTPPVPAKRTAADIARDLVDARARSAEILEQQQRCDTESKALRELEVTNQRRIGALHLEWDVFTRPPGEKRAL